MPSTSCAASVNHEAAGGQLPPWRPVLYEWQPYPDNYTDKTYLASVLTNASQVQISFKRLVVDSAVITRQVSAVAVFCVLFLHTYYSRVSASALMAIELLLLLVGWRGQRWVLHRDTWRLCIEALRDAGLRSEARQLALLVGWLLSLSPLIGTLTRTFSDDTICALTISLFLMHLTLHDYAYASNYTNDFRGTLSLNAAVFASVLLAARLPSTTHVFAVMTLAVQMFVLLPAQLRLLSGSLSSAQHTVGTGLLVLLTTALILTFSRALVVAYLASILTISLLCPWLLVHLQHQKSEISGPWDAAVRAFLLAPTSETQ